MDNAKYPRVETLVLDWLKPLGKPVFTETDEDLPNVAPAIKAAVFGGSTMLQNTRSPVVEIATYAVGRGSALDLMDEVDQRMMQLAGNGFPDRYVDNVRLVFHPSVQPYSNTGLHQAIASYAVDVRPQ